MDLNWGRQNPPEIGILKIFREWHHPTYKGSSKLVKNLNHSAKRSATPLAN